jgi:hypothetical protein
VITPESPEHLYSTRLRTAVVLTGAGTAGAYHAGVLRALHEAGVRTDLVAGHGIGAAGAMFAAVDGGARLWDGTGLWKAPAAAKLYAWRLPLRMAGWALAAAAAILLFPVLLLALAILIGMLGLLLTLVGLGDLGTLVTVGFTTRLSAWFDPGGLPLIVPRLVLLAVLVAGVALLAGWLAQVARPRIRRRTGRGFWWRLVGSPMSAGAAFDAFAGELWKLIRGAAPLQRPPDVELGRRYVELLSENLGQPGFRELLVVVHDLDARRDLVFGFLSERHRARFFGQAGAARAGGRAFEALDLSGVGRDHAMDMLSAALAMPLAIEPHPVSLAVEGPWRGETHRACDRPGALARVVEEVAASGVEQVILVSPAARPGRPHELGARRGELRGRAGQALASFESAGLRDVIEEFAGRFAGFHVIRPEHNPLGALDFGGVHDERSDRRFTLAELVDRGYKDAYRQFIEPVVGASGERIATVQ